MTPDRWRRVRRLFERAIAAAPDERRALLDAECVDDPALRREVESLLAHDDSANNDANDSLGVMVGVAAQDLVDEHATTHAPLTGQRIGRISVRELLGQGGMGEVYVGFDETLERPVALKVIRAKDRLAPSSRARFQREARILSQLDHPNICRIHDYLEGDDHDYLVLELIRGRTLAEALEAGLTPAQKRQAAIQIAEVLALAHGHGIVHRDLKPRNVMLTQDGQVKVLDFGLARANTPNEAPDDLATAGTTTVEARPPAADPGAVPLHTRNSQLLGTPVYMSPEQALGEVVTTATDLYSFGLLLQRLFSRASPYPPGLDAEAILDRAQRGDTLPPLGVAPDLARLITHLKSRAPAARPTAEAALERLRWIDGKPQRRLRWSIAAALMLVVTLAAAKYTFDLKDARDRADQRRTQAEGLIGFMIGDLRSKLAPVNRLEVMDDIGEKARAYFATVPADALSTTELLFRSQTLSQIGQVRLDQGDLAAAEEAFGESLALANDLNARDPANLEWLAWLGTGHFWLGNVAWLREDSGDALVHFRAYLDATHVLVDHAPDNPDWLLELSYAHNNVGSALSAQGQSDPAIAAFRASLDLKQQLVSLEPTNPLWLRDLAGSHSWLGEALFDVADLAGAHEHFEANRTILATLSAQEAANTQWRFLLGIAHEKVGYVLDAQGQAPEARVHFERYRDLFNTLVQGDPDNASWRRELAVAHLRLGQQALRAGDARAIDPLTTAEADLLTLVQADPTNHNWRRQLAASQIARGVLLNQQKDVMAEALLQSAVTTLDAIGAATEVDIATRRLHAEADLALGDLYARTGRIAASVAAFEHALDHLSQRAATTRHPLDRVLHAFALVRLGRVPEARPLALALAQDGFRRRDFARLCHDHQVPLDPATA